MSTPHQQAGLLAVFSADAFWHVLQSVAQHGPSWSTIPPLLLGTAGLVGAINTARNDSQRRRHAEEQHRAELAALERKPHVPGFESLN